MDPDTHSEMDADTQALDSAGSAPEGGGERDAERVIQESRTSASLYTRSTIVGIAIVLCSMLGVTVLGAAWYGVLPFVAKRAPSPEVVLFTALQKTVQAPSLAFEGTLQSKGRALAMSEGSAGGSLAEFTMSYRGAYQYGQITHSGYVETENYLAIKGISVELDVDMRWMGTDVYLKLGRIGLGSDPRAFDRDDGNAMGLAMVAGMIQMIQGQWIYLPVQEMIDTYGDRLEIEKDEFPALAERIEEVDREAVQSFIEENYTDIVALFAIRERADDGEDTRTFDLTFDMEEITQFLIDQLVPFVRTQVGEEQANTFQKGLEEARSQYATYQPIPLSITINMEGYVSELAIPSIIQTDAEHIIEISWTTRFSQFRAPILVTVPDDAVTLDVLLQGLSETMRPTAESSAEVISVDALHEVIPGGSLFAHIPLHLPLDITDSPINDLDMRANALNALCSALVWVSWCR